MGFCVVVFVVVSVFFFVVCLFFVLFVGIVFVFLSLHPPRWQIPACQSALDSGSTAMDLPHADSGQDTSAKMA